MPRSVRDRDQRISKRFGSVQAVSDLSFEVEAGRVTGFLGPNGAGKSTTLRILLGLVHADGGSATFDGRNFEKLPEPSAEVGAVLEDASFHPGRSGRNHLRILAAAGGHPASRVDEVLELVGIADAGDRLVKGYSMGMRQRLAIAAALLGDPEVLILDEPANGLDPPGIRWMRELLRSEAGRGRAVLVSSHLLSEVSQSVDDVVVIAHGKLRTAGSLQQVLGQAEGGVTRVRARDREALGRALAEAAGQRDGDSLLVHAASRRGRRDRAGGPGGADACAAHVAGDGLLRAHRGRAVSPLLRAELLKLRTTRTFITLVSSRSRSLIVVGLTDLADDFTHRSVLRRSPSSGLFILLLGVTGMVAPTSARARIARPGAAVDGQGHLLRRGGHRARRSSRSR